MVALYVDLILDLSFTISKIVAKHIKPAFSVTTICNIF